MGAPRPPSGRQRSGSAARHRAPTCRRWRARSSAVLTGAGTVRADDPRLDVRLNYGPWVRQPLRVVLDPGAHCAPSAKVFAGGGALVFAAADAQPPPCWPSRPAACQPSSACRRRWRGLDLGAVIERLSVLEVNELWVECGPRLAAAFLEAKLVDELILYVAPMLLGADAAPLTALSGLPRRVRSRRHLNSRTWSAWAPTCGSHLSPRAAMRREH